MNVLVTGGAGYIGTHVVLELLDAGHRVVVVDDLSTGHRELVDERARLVVADIADCKTVESVLAGEKIEAVIHLAARIDVQKSLQEPLKYYFDNVDKSRSLIEQCVNSGVRRFVFSSSAAVYGQPDIVPADESTPTRPINPYGRSKLMIEWILQDVAQAGQLEYVALRYFNVAGADPGGRTGQAKPNATNLMTAAVETALGTRSRLEIFGTDHPTDDGTCIRDYIHVSDLASVHRHALRYLDEGGTSRTLNCGYGRGFSVRQVVDAVRRISERRFPVEETSARPADPPEVVADSSRLKELFDWNPRFDQLDDIIGTALAWQRSRSQKSPPQNEVAVDA